MLQIKRHGLYALRSSQSPTQQRSHFTTANNSSQAHPKRYSSIKWHKSANYRFAAAIERKSKNEKERERENTTIRIIFKEREARTQINISLEIRLIGPHRSSIQIEIDTLN